MTEKRDASFRQITEPLFDSSEAALRLVTVDNLHNLERTVLFAGLSTWVLVPHDRKAIRDAMVLKAYEVHRRNLKAFREKYRKDNNKSCSSATAEAGVRRQHKAFYREVFGRLESRTIETCSLDALKKTLSAALPHIERTVKLVGVFHYVAAELVPRGYLPPSVLRGKRILAQLSRSPIETGRQLKGVTGHGIHQSWSKQREAAHFLYAASVMSLTGGKTLLDHLLSRGPYRREIDLRQWFARANFVASHVLRSTEDRRGTLAPYDLVSGISDQVFAPPKFEDADRQLIQAAFTRARAAASAQTAATS